MFEIAKEYRVRQHNSILLKLIIEAEVEQMLGSLADEYGIVQLISS